MIRLPSLLLLAAVATPAALHAQVGFPPAASPFRDLLYRQEAAVSVGLFRPRKDPAGVAPGTGPMVVARHTMQFSSPLFITTQLGTVFSERTVLDPTQPLENREVGTSTTQLFLADFQVGVALTGFRSWRGLVPEVSGGLGFVTDFASADVGGYRFGTPLAILLGGGVRWAPGASSRWQLRADLSDRIYKIPYPQSYFTSTGGLAPILANRESNSAWTHNAGLTIGVGYLFDR